MRNILLVRFLVLGLFISIPSGNLFAQTAYESLGTGDWGDPLTWSPNGVPDVSASDTAAITDAAHTVTVEADHSAAGTVFQDDGWVEIVPDATLTSPVTTSLADQGNLGFSGSNGTVAGNVGAGGAYLYQIKVVANGSGTVDGDVFVGTGGVLLDAAAAEGDTTEFRITDGHSLDGVVQTSLDGAGTLTSLGTNEITGQVGVSGTSLLAVQGGEGDGETNYTTTFDSDVFAQNLTVTGQGGVVLKGNFTGNAVFADDGTLTFDGNGTLNGAVTANEDGQGTLTFLGNSEITGQVGTSGEISQSVKAVYGGAGDGETSYTTMFDADVCAQTVYVTGRGTVQMGGNLTGEVVFQDDGTLAMNGGGSLTGAVTTDQDGQGTLDFINASSISGDIGSSGLSLGGLKTWNEEFTVSAQNVYATQITTCGQECSLYFQPSEDSLLIRADIKVDEEGGSAWNDTLSFYGNVDLAGDIGTSDFPYYEIQLHGAFEPSTFAFTGNMEAYYIWFYDNADITLALTDANINFAWIGSQAENAAVEFSGSNTFDGWIGDSDSLIARVNFNSGDTTLTCLENGGSFWGEAAEWNVNSGAAVRLSNGGEFYGPMTVNNGGTLDLKDKTATMHDGYTLASGGILRLTVHDTGNFGKLVVLGGDATAAAGSKILVDVAGDASITEGDTFQVVSVSSIGAGSLAAPGVEDDSSEWDFEAAANDLGGGAWEILLTAGAVETASYAEQAGNGNAQGAGAALDDIKGAGASGDMQDVLDTLDGLTPDQVGSALDSMLPDLSGSNPQVPALLMDNFLGTQMGRLGGVMETARAKGDGETGMAAGDQPGKSVTWLRAFGNAAHQDPRGTSDGYNLSNGGGAVGVERVISDQFRTGLAFGEARGYVRSKDNAGRTEVLATMFSWYGGYNAPQGPLYLQYALSYAYQNYDGSREIYVGPADQRVANADFHGDLYGGMVEAGYGLGIGRAILTPAVSLSYYHLHIAKYKETDAGALNLDVGGQDYDRLRAALGLKLAATKDGGFGRFTPEVHARFLYDLIADRQQIAASFSGGGPAFSTEGFKPARSGAEVGTSLTLATRRNMTLTLQYDFEVREDYYSHTGFLNVAFRF